MMAAKILGINDDVTTCECCGRTGLKKTVVLDIEGVGIVHYGSDCAATKLHGKKAARKMVDSVATAMDFARRWLPTRPADLVANAIRVRFCDAYAVGGKLFVNGTEVAA